MDGGGSWEDVSAAACDTPQRKPPLAGHRADPAVSVAAAGVVTASRPRLHHSRSSHDVSRPGFSSRRDRAPPPPPPPPAAPPLLPFGVHPGSSDGRGPSPSPVLLAAAGHGGVAPTSVAGVSTLPPLAAMHALAKAAAEGELAAVSGVRVFQEGYRAVALGTGRLTVTHADFIFELDPLPPRPARSPHLSPASAGSGGVAPQPAALVAAASHATAAVGRALVVPRQALLSVTAVQPAAATAASFTSQRLPRNAPVARLVAARGEQPALHLALRDARQYTVVLPAPAGAAGAAEAGPDAAALVVRAALAPGRVHRLAPTRGHAAAVYAATPLARRLPLPIVLCNAVDPGFQRAQPPRSSSAPAGPPAAAAGGPGHFPPMVTPPATTSPAPGCVFPDHPVAAPSAGSTAGTGSSGGTSPASAPAAAATPTAAREPVPAGNAAGFFVYDPRSEFQRQGLDTSRVFRLCVANSAFAVCPTYPKAFAVPAALSDAEVKAEAARRARRRVHALTYHHAGRATALFRCAQPTTGADVRRWLFAAEVTPMVAAIRAACPAQRLKILDLRPYKNALANVVVGGGYEASGQRDVEVIFGNIENVQKVNAAYAALTDLVLADANDPASPRSDKNPSASPGAFAAAVAATQWVEYVHALLRVAGLAARFLVGDAAAVASPLHGPFSDAAPAAAADGGAAVGVAAPLTPADPAGAVGCNVVVHCSDGWDRTSQVCALSQLLLDPYFRTVRGFCVLVEKDFVFFGHQFRARSAYVGANYAKAPNGGGGGGHGEPSPAPRREAIDALVEGAAEGGSFFVRLDDPPAAPAAPSSSPMGAPPAFASGDDGAAAGHEAGGEACPIFLQFLDCVAQLVAAYPQCFEFTDQMLLFIADAYHSGFYGNFACNNLAELLSSGLPQSSASLFAELTALAATQHAPSTPVVAAPATPTAADEGVPVGTGGATGRKAGLRSVQSYDDIVVVDPAASPVRGRSGGDESPPADGYAANLPSAMLNPQYLTAEQQAAMGLATLAPPGPHQVRLWEAFWLRFSDDIEPTAVVPIVPLATPPGHGAHAASVDEGSGSGLPAVPGPHDGSFDNMSIGSGVASPNVSRNTAAALPFPVPTARDGGVSGVTVAGLPPPSVLPSPTQRTPAGGSPAALSPQKAVGPFDGAPPPPPRMVVPSVLQHVDESGEW